MLARWQRTVAHTPPANRSACALSDAWAARARILLESVGAKPHAHPSTGFLAALFAWPRCASLSLLGFGGAAHARGHVWGDEAPPAHIHDFAAEHAIFERLAHGERIAELDEAFGRLGHWPNVTLF